MLGRSADCKCKDRCLGADYNVVMVKGPEVYVCPSEWTVTVSVPVSLRMDSGQSVSWVSALSMCVPQNGL